MLDKLKEDLSLKMQQNTKEYPVLICGRDHSLPSGEKAIWLKYAEGADPAAFPKVKACYFYYPTVDDPSGLTPEQSKAAGHVRVFGYLAIPEKAKKGIVCVHGGAGHAYAMYAQEAYNHGYAAIAIDTEGCHATTPDMTGADQPDPYSFFKQGGTYVEAKDGFRTAKEPLEKQWMYYAISDCAFANTILRSFVADHTSVGITGISWGGLTTTIASCYDSRFAFAVPIYLSYCLGYGRNSSQFGALRDAFAADLWQAEDVLKAQNIPTLIINSQKDPWADLHSSVSTYELLQQNNRHSYLLVKPDLGHSQQAGAGIAEIYRFGDWVLSSYDNEKCFFTLDTTPKKQNGRRYTTDLTVPTNVSEPHAVLYYTTAPITYGDGGVVNETFFTKELTLTYLRADEKGNSVYQMDVALPDEAYLYFISFYGNSQYDAEILPTYGASEKYHGKIYSSTCPIILKA